MRDKSELRNYQHTAIDHIIQNPHCALFLEMGLGKTVSTLTAINYLMYEELEINKVLVISPKRVAEEVWDEEINEWNHLLHLRVSKIIGTEKQRRAALAKKADIYLLGRDNVAWLCAQYGGLKLPFDMLVIDESSSFKNSKSVRFKSLKRTQPYYKRIVELTGTPAPNGLVDLWSQIYLLDRGKRLFRFFETYKAEYFKPDKRNGDTIYSYKLRKQSEEEIHEKIKDICLSMKTDDYLDLPEKISNIIKIHFPPAIAEKYEEFEKEKVLELFSGKEEGETISAVNAAALSNKLLQFSNGAVYDEDKNYHVVHNLKIEVTKELIEDANGKSILIAWTYRHDLYRLKEALSKYNPRELKTPQDSKDWNAGKIQVLLMHPASGGHGLNLQFGGHTIIWFGQTWSSELEQQLNARLRRPGQKFPVIINKLVIRNTLDEDVIFAQERKQKTQEGLMQAVKARIEKYVQY